MKLRFFGSTPSDRPKAIAVLAVLFLLAFARYFHAPGDDLAVSYLGCRLVATHQTQFLYSYDPDTFSDVAENDTAWQEQADQTNFIGFVHPYVQTPLWAWSLQPLCKHVDFPAFDALFCALSLASFMAMTWLVARFWTPDLLNPIALGLLLLVFSRSEPFRYAMVLMQTHILYLLLSIVSLLLANRRRPVAAGILLALAASVKITPGFLILYWLLTRRYRAAVTAILCSVILLAAAVFAAGRPLFATFLADLHRISDVLLVSANNQSFAAWAMGSHFPTSQLNDLIIHDLPPTLRLGSNLLVLLSVLVGGLLDRRSQDTPDTNSSASPIGAIFAIVGTTLFTPIAWSHYFIVLLPAVMLLLQQAHTASLQHRRRFARTLFTLTVLLCVFNFRPFAGNVVHETPGLFGIVRPHFYAGVLCLLALLLAGWQRRGARTRPPLLADPA